MLKSDTQLKPITVLSWLQQKCNLPESDPSEHVVPDSLRRTLAAGQTKVDLKELLEINRRFLKSSGNESIKFVLILDWKMTFEYEYRLRLSIKKREKPYFSVSRRATFRRLVRSIEAVG